jgi:CheY-like chemotaxis protein
MKPEIVTFRIDDLMRQLAVEFLPLAREKSLTLTFVPCSLTVRSDRRLLRRLLQNLVSNAIKYTPKGRVLVGCRPRGDRLRIDVYDTGLGIPQEQTGEIFKEFHRLDQGAKVARGLGLGLSIVERIARVLNHKVAITSVVGRGSNFSLHVPRGEALPNAMRPREPRRAEIQQLGGMAIVCVDNEANILDGMEALLGGWGCAVFKAPDLKSAIATLRAATTIPTGVLVDYHLDDGNGIDAINALRRIYGPALPAILITADRGLHVREDARAHDIPVLHKPIKPAALRALIAQWRAQRVVAAE